MNLVHPYRDGKPCRDARRLRLLRYYRNRWIATWANLAAFACLMLYVALGLPRWVMQHDWTVWPVQHVLILGFAVCEIVNYTYHRKQSYRLVCAAFLTANTLFIIACRIYIWSRS